MPICRMLPFITMIADYAVSLAENGWHDRWSGAQRHSQRPSLWDRNWDWDCLRVRPYRAFLPAFAFASLVQLQVLRLDSVTVQLQWSSNKNSYLNNHFFWQPTWLPDRHPAPSDNNCIASSRLASFFNWAAFLSYLFHYYYFFIILFIFSFFIFFSFALARFSCLFDLWSRDV